MAVTDKLQPIWARVRNQHSYLDFPPTTHPQLDVEIAIMAPSVTIDNSSDFEMPTAAPTKQSRTLLLAPPSLSAHPEALTRVLEAHDRNATDIQMLDRLALGLVSLPVATYDVVMLLTDVDGSRQESSRLLDRAIIERIAQALNTNGRLVAQNGQLGRAEQTEAILGGLVSDGGEGMLKPKAAAEQTVTLSFGKKKKANAAAVPLNGIEAANTAKRKSEDISTMYGGGVQAPVKAAPSGVGFVDFSDDLDMEYDDEDEEMEIPSNEELGQAGRIDPDSLLTEEDRQRPIVVRKLLFLCPVQTRGPWLICCSQLTPANPIPSVVVLARTAHAASHKNLKLKTRPSVSMRTPIWPNSLPTISQKSTSQCKAKWVLVATARWETRSDVMGARILDCQHSSQARRSGCSTMMCSCRCCEHKPWGL